MSTHDRQEEELKKQIEKIAESVKEKGEKSQRLLFDYFEFSRGSF